MADFQKIAHHLGQAWTAISTSDCTWWWLIHKPTSLTLTYTPSTTCTTAFLAPHPYLGINSANAPCFYGSIDNETIITVERDDNATTLAQKIESHLPNLIRWWHKAQAEANAASAQRARRSEYCAILQKRYPGVLCPDPTTYYNAYGNLWSCSLHNTEPSRHEATVTFTGTFDQAIDLLDLYHQLTDKPINKKKP